MISFILCSTCFKDYVCKCVSRLRGEVVEPSEPVKVLQQGAFIENSSEIANRCIKEQAILFLQERTSDNLLNIFQMHSSY